MSYPIGDLIHGAASGDLRIEDGIAQRCVAACSDLLSDLNDAKVGASGMSTMSAYGTLESAMTLGAKFDRKALGVGGFQDVLQQHIDTVLQLRDLFEKAGRAYREADARAAEVITSTTGGA